MAANLRHLGPAVLVATVAADVNEDLARQPPHVFAELKLPGVGVEPVDFYAAWRCWGGIGVQVSVRTCRSIRGAWREPDRTEAPKRRASRGRKLI